MTTVRPASLLRNELWQMVGGRLPLGATKIHNGLIDRSGRIQAVLELLMANDRALKEGEIYSDQKWIEKSCKFAGTIFTKSRRENFCRWKKTGEKLSVSSIGELISFANSILKDATRLPLESDVLPLQRLRGIIGRKAHSQHGPPITFTLDTINVTWFIKGGLENAPNWALVSADKINERRVTALSNLDLSAHEVYWLQKGLNALEKSEELQTKNGWPMEYRQARWKMGMWPGKSLEFVDKRGLGRRKKKPSDQKAT